MSLSPKSEGTGLGRLDWTVYVLVIIFAGCIYALSVRASQPGLFYSTPSGYYGLQTQAFRMGQLHLPIKADPKLLELANPYAGPQGANRPHDMSFYKGKFYLYYGVTPVILIYLPWLIFTGTYLNEMAGMVIQLWIGFAAAAFWLTTLKRRHSPSVSPGWLAAILVTLAIGTPIFVAAQNTTFYGVPIAGAFCCLMLALVALDRAFQVEELGRQAVWIGFASLAWGLSVAARPIYLLGLPILGICAIVLWWKSGAFIRSTWPGIRLLVAAVIPAALVGLGLLTYNYLRFDSPWEFGIRFSLTSTDIREDVLIGTEFIPKNLDLYLFGKATLIRYFPFLATGERPFGILRYMPWLWVAALLPMAVWFGPCRKTRWIAAALAMLGAAAANFFMLSLFFGGEDRYLLDFTPPLFLTASLVALGVLQGTSQLRQTTLHRVAASFLGLALGVTLFNGCMLGLARHGDHERVFRIARLLNIPTATLEANLPERHGPVELQVRFPFDRVGKTEPLVVSGGIANTGDLVTVTYLPDNRLVLGYFHLGIGGPSSDPIPYDPGVPHTIRITMGGLYPPAQHPRFQGWSNTEIARVRRQLKFEFDGRTVLEGTADSYASTPGLVRLGINDLANNVTEPNFNGEILNSKFMGIEKSTVPLLPLGTGPIKLRFKLPAGAAGGIGLPLVSTGRNGAGDLVFVRVTAPGRLVLGHDNWGSPVALSSELSFNPNEIQTAEIEMGSLYPPEDNEVPERLRRRLRLSFNGETVFDFERPFYPSSADQVEVAYNSIHADAATSAFTGRLLAVERIDSAPPAQTTEVGPLRLTLLFPRELPTATEPLVITGTAGRADIVYVRYGPNRTVQFGFDHWGVGGTLGDPISIDTAAIQHIEVHLKSLMPASDDEPVATEVRLNGKVVLQSELSAYSATEAPVAVGRNDIGASTCTELFSGQVILVERLTP